MASVSESRPIRQNDNSRCRICMFPKQNLSSLFRRGGLSMKIMKLAEIKMYEGDGLPPTICLDCEVEVNRCVNFIGHIQRADAKLREMLVNGTESIEVFERVEESEEREQEATTSQIDIEEFNVKQEMILDNLLEEKTDAISESDYHHFDTPLENNVQPEEEAELNPLDHVDVVEDRNRSDAMEVPVDPFGQEEPLIESQKSESDPTADPLICMKQEAVSMDVDKNSPQPCGSSSMVEQTTVFIECTPTLHLLDESMDIHKRKNTETVHNTYKDSASSTSKSRSTKVKGSCQKLRKTQDIVKSNPISTKECIEQKIPQKNNEVKFVNELYCVICNLNFTSVEEHKNKQVFLCRLCTEEFKSHNELETHFYTHSKIKCKLCKKQFFSKKDLQQHRSKTHTTKKIECATCLKPFANRDTLKRHMILAHGEGEGNCTCVVCEKNFKCSFQLKQHLVRSHTAYEHIECKFCPLLYVGPNKLQAHIKEIHLDSEENNPVSCSTCGKLFSRAKLLAKHQQTHDNIESNCEICGKLIKTRSLMKSHMERQHSKTGTFKCKICNEKFGVQKELKIHQQIHFRKPTSKPQSFFCEICGKIYKTLQILTLHKAIHADERPFKCEICGATFKQSVTLQTHQRVHDKDSKYTCNGCGISFRWKQTLDKHISKCAINLNSDNK